MKKINCALIVLFLFTVFSVKAQSDITGQVTDELQSPLAGATVQILNTPDSQEVKSIITDSMGMFRFDQLKSGKYLLKVSFIAFDTAYWPVTVEGHSTSPLIISLKPDNQQFQDVVVRGRKPTITMHDGKATMNVEASPLAQSQSAFDLLKDLPGVTITKEGEIKVRGKSGVTVMIDGEPVEIGSNQLKNMLKSTPGTALQSIEVMNNPSASMDAAGNGGVINFKFKKKMTQGFNGTINSGIGWGRYLKTDHSVSFSKGTEKWNLNATYAIDIDKSWQRDSTYRSISGTGKPLHMEQIQLSPQRTTSHLARLSVDRYFGQRQTLGIALSYNHFTNPFHGYAHTRLYEKLPVIDSSLDQRSDIRNTYNNLEGALKYRLRINDNQSLTAAFQATLPETTGTEEFRIRSTGINGTVPSSTRFRNTYPGTVNRYSLRADYIRDIMSLSEKIGRIEIGIKSTIARIGNRQEAENTYGNNWQKDASRSNRFRYKEAIQAAYAAMELGWEKWELSAGLRGEQTGIRGDSMSGPRLVKQDYLSLFPNIKVGYKFSEQYKLTLSYNRRIGRPDYDKLNPAARYSDVYTIQTGNPYLKPQFSDNLEINQQFFGFIDLTLGYSFIKDPLYFSFLSEIGNLQSRYTTINAGKQQQWFAAMSFPIPGLTWWENYQTFYSYSSRFNAVINRQVYREKATSFGISTYNAFKLPASFNLELNGWYESSGLYGNFRYRPTGELSIGINKRLFTDKLNVGVSVNDIFYTNIFRSSLVSKTEGPSYVDSRTDSRMVKFTLSWRIGKKPSTDSNKSGEDKEDDRLPSGRSKQAIKKPAIK